MNNANNQGRSVEDELRALSPLALQRRRRLVLDYVQSCRAALLCFREALDTSLAKTLPRLDAMQAWAEGGELPGFVGDFLALDEAVIADCTRKRDTNQDPCSCGACESCERVVAERDYWGLLELEDALVDAMYIVRDGTGGKSGAASVMDHLENMSDCFSIDSHADDLRERTRVALHGLKCGRAVAEVRDA